MIGRTGLRRWFSAGILAGLMLVPTGVRAAWLRSDQSIGWGAGDVAVWRFTFDAAKGKTFFHPLSVDGVFSLTNFQPEDHPWHYGLWLSWKYINGANYWEEDRATGRAEGSTRWSPPRIETRPDGSAVIHYEVTYAHPTGRVDLREQRDLVISAPTAQGSYTIDWRSRFTAGEKGAELTRTPMPGEPGGQINGGYAGLGLRLASAPAGVAFVTTESEVTQFAGERARPSSPALGCNVSLDGQVLGSIAILSDPANAGARAPWYLVNGAMRFVCAAVLAPKPRVLPAGSEWSLRYRIIVAPWAWTPNRLKSAVANWHRG